MFNNLKQKLSGLKDTFGNVLDKKADEASEVGTIEEPALSPDIIREKKDKSTSIGDQAKALLMRREFIINEKSLEEPLWDLEMALLESDVAMPVAEEVVAFVKEELTGTSFKIGENKGKIIEQALKNALIRVLSVEELDFDDFVRSADKPVTVAFVGVNGTGKTTSIAKVTRRLLKNGHSVVIAAADTFRAGAIDQIQHHADKLGVKLIKHKEGSDPAAVVYDAVEYAKARHIDVVLADTAGRMHTNINLMDQLKKICRVAPPDLVIFVDEAIAGNDAVERAALFNNAVPVDGNILTKADADSKGGAAISVAYATGKPILFLGVGQEYDDMVKFDPQWLVDRLFE
ncbi:MAG: signal recognition particle-docking protein FtsY [ANME-2 cluster archaeon]|nr:signal recognition particle-docking protein FtsY [ANME-2 cluster archaeon]